MFSLVYVSAAVTWFSDRELRDLLAQCRLSNAQTGITGMLLYKDGDFMQLLEGEEATVRALFDRISRDPRHQHSFIVLEEEVGQRLFGEWAMGFRSLDDDDVRSIHGFSEFMNRHGELAGLRGRPDTCLDLLRFFAAGR